MKKVRKVMDDTLDVLFPEKKYKRKYVEYALLCTVLAIFFGCCLLAII